MIIYNKESHGLIWIQIGKEAIRDANGEVQAIDGKIELDIGSKGQLSRILNGISAQRNPHVLLDLGLVSYVDSSALWEIYDGYQKIIKSGGKFGLLHLNPDVKRIFDLTKLSKRIPIFKDPEEARQAIKGAP